MNLRFESFSETHLPAVREMLERDAQNSALFLRVLQDMPGAHEIVWADGRLAALTCRAMTDRLLLIFVAPERRRQGIGSAVLHRAEEQFSAGKLSGFYNIGCSAAEAFAKKHGYARHYDCAYMEYTGEPFPVEPIPVRPYTDADYPESQSVRANAFHRMRVAVGDFPESTVAQPSEADRRVWAEEAENYFLYTDHGEIVGVGCLTGNEIFSVSVRCDRQGQGIGRKFVPYLANILLRRGYGTVALECVVGNPARRLYDRLGFTEVYTERFVQKQLCKGDAVPDSMSTK
ncbi:MAG: GNAT family N-acetyltransferase [Hominenteromicrobium sp.]